ncbi:MFS transporter [Neobacillus cucumis]|uniref:MFS transporter n=1 Tax=Neobacillus cucumis TaxID=1740721 RepID=UPI0019668162|nr:MFS transporter [Neobacillus cucumis]MBM7652606.1 putative MFS transporter [Neobacillus cucumis]MED4224913.1 MFS transporter [Neobacillus cucumis]
MNEKTYRIDDAPLNKFHIKITALTFGSNFSDGYALGIIGMALSLLSPQMHLSPLWNGLIGSSALIGLFFGSLLLGGLSDKIGRQKIFLSNFVIITVASALQFFINDPVTLFILRILIGIALGGDYAVGSTLLAEFAPRKYRGILLSSLNVLWTVGYVLSNVVGYYLGKMGPDSWRWMLVSAVVPAVIVLVMRIGTPESPRWLVKMGRQEEAREIVRKYIGPYAVMEETTSQDAATKYGFKDLFNKHLWKRTAFGGLFYLCQVVPYFAIYTFLPTILEKLGFEETFTVDMLLNLFLLVGSIAGLWCTEKLSRRGFTIYTFIILTISLFILSLIPAGSHAFAIMVFAIFTFVMAAASNLTIVYPAELFPTEIRGTGVGVVTAISRIGSAIGTFLLPISVSSFGMTTSMISMSVILFIGTVVSIVWAPETKALGLNEASDPNLDVDMIINGEGKSVEIGR